MHIFLQNLNLNLLNKLLLFSFLWTIFLPGINLIEVGKSPKFGLHVIFLEWSKLPRIIGLEQIKRT